MYLHRLDGKLVPNLSPVSTKSGPNRAPDADLNSVYTRMLDCLTLSEPHRADLRRRGLTDEQIDRGGYRTLPGPGRADLLHRLRQDFPDELLLAVPGIWYDGERWRLAGSPGYLIPARLGGNIVALVIRRDEPGEGGKYQWLSSAGAKDGKPRNGCSPGSRPHVPLGTPPIAETVRITEGTLKADVATALDPRMPCLGMPGLAWRTTLPLLRQMKVKTVLLAFDADRDRNPHVAAALAAAVIGLRGEGLAVLVEEWDGARGKGIDDALSAGLAIVASPAKEVITVNPTPAPESPSEITPTAGLEVREAADDPHRLARIFLQQHTLSDGLALRWWREEWYEWKDGAYILQLDKEVKASLGCQIKAEFDRLNIIEQTAGVKVNGAPPVTRKVTTRLLADVSVALTGLACVPSSIEQPAWLDRDGPYPAAELLVCRNGAVHLPSWSAGKDYWLPLTPRLFTANALPYNFDPKAPEPAEWAAFLTQLWEDDLDSFQALQEWMGYLLLPDTRQQKIGMLIGPRRSGKGVIGRVLTQLIGPGNVCTPTLASLGGPFGLQPLLGKTAAVISDARLSSHTDTAVVTERLLAISGEDGQTVDRKFLTPITKKLPVRFTILSNELPQLTDNSGALPGRLHTLRLTKSFYGKEDTGLTDRLLKELPGILLWAMRGWEALRTRGYFLLPEASKPLSVEMEDLASPVGAFVRQCCEVGPGFTVPIPQLYQAWCDWCEARRVDPGSDPVFGRNLRAAVPGLDVAQKRDGDTRHRVYRGVRPRLSP
jgi:putative DNA primase/helicase